MAYDMTEVMSIYQTLTDQVTVDLNNQFKLGRIKSTEFADVYNSLTAKCLDLAMQGPVLDSKVENSGKDLELKEAQKALYVRQTEGFDDDLRRKMLEIQMNTWGMMFSSGLLEEKPSIITNDEVSDIYCFMKQQVMETPCNPTPPLNDDVIITPAPGTN